MQLTLVGREFHLSRREFCIPNGLSLEEWGELYEHVDTLSDMAQWAKVDLVEYGLTRYGDDAYAVVGDQTRLSLGTLYNMRSVARRIPKENRIYDLSFSHYVEVAKLTPESQAKWLAWAVDQGASRDDLRVALAGGDLPQRYLPAVVPSTPVSALYWVKDWLEGRIEMTTAEVLEIINEVVQRYSKGERDAG